MSYLNIFKNRVNILACQKSNEFVCETLNYFVIKNNSNTVRKHKIFLKFLKNDNCTIINKNINTDIKLIADTLTVLVNINYRETQFFIENSILCEYNVFDYNNEDDKLSSNIFLDNNTDKDILRCAFQVQQIPLVTLITKTCIVYTKCNNYSMLLSQSKYVFDEKYRQNTTNLSLAIQSDQDNKSKIPQQSIIISKGSIDINNKKLNRQAPIFCPSSKDNSIHVLNKYPKNINIFQINLQGMLESNHFDEFRNEVMKSNNLHICSVNETWTRDKFNTNKSIAIPNFSVVRSDRKYSKHDRNKGGGVAIYIKNGINFKVIEKSSSSSINVDGVEFLALEIKTKFNKLFLISVYRTNKCSGNPIGI